MRWSSPRSPSDLPPAFPLAESAGKWESKGAGRQLHGIQMRTQQTGTEQECRGEHGSGARRPPWRSRARE